MRGQPGGVRGQPGACAFRNQIHERTVDPCDSVGPGDSSKVAQTVHIPRADCTASFAAGEWIWTESSYKYDADEVVATVEEAGFRCHEQWIEPDARFDLTLFVAE